jgi:hypothetical protein
VTRFDNTSFLVRLKTIGSVTGRRKMCDCKVSHLIENLTGGDISLCAGLSLEMSNFSTCRSIRILGTSTLRPT